MKNITINPKPIGGTLTMPPSKSMSHRLVICAALAEGTSVIRNVLLSDDIRATCGAMEALGAEITFRKEPGETCSLIISGTASPDAEGKTIDCFESGSTLRFLTPVLALSAEKTRIIGRGRLGERPMKPYRDAFTAQGMAWECEEEGKELPLVLTGRLKPGNFQLPGNVSSQFVSGLLFALPLLSEDSTIELTSPLESKPYVDMTVGALKTFGIKIDETKNGYAVSGNQSYRPGNCRVEGDYSQAAFWLAAGTLGKNSLLLDLNQTSEQGDQVIVDILRKMGGRIAETKRGIFVSPSSLNAVEVDVSQCPDLVPMIAFLCAAAEGKSRIFNAGRLRFKESDRLAAVTEVLTALGAEVEENRDSLVILGNNGKLTGGTISSHNDHRIAMAAAAASSLCSEPLTITGADCVAKSYPGFWRDFVKMGGEIS